MLGNSKISDLFNIEKGTLQSLKNITGEYDFITASSEWKKHNSYTHDTEALIFAMGASGSLGRTHYVKGKFIASDLCYILTPKQELEKTLDLEFYYIFFNLIRENIVNQTASGTSKLAINLKKFSNFQIICPAIADQLRIKKKIGAIQPESNSLYSNFSDSQEKIKTLRGSILQDAIQGKLVPQDPNDEPAEKLLEKIKTEKEGLIKEGKLKKEKPLPSIPLNEIPFELPKGWIWIRLGEIVSIKGGKRVPRGYQLLQTPTNHIYIRVTDMKNGTIDKSNLRYIDNRVFNIIKNYTISKNDLYITIAGTIGQVGEIPKEFDGMNLTENAAKITPFAINIQYLKYLLLSSFCKQQFMAKIKQMAQPKLALIRIQTTIIPFPPINEQDNIVKKIGALMGICDEQEKNLTEAKDNINKLNQAILSEVFRGEL